MRNYVKKISFVLVSIGFSIAHAGSYEDFFVAIKRDDAAVVLSLLQRGFDANAPSPSGQPALIAAIAEPAPKVSQVLVAWPATKVEIRNKVDESPLMMAALKGQLELCRQLIARDADVNKTGWTPLHYAASNGHVEVMRLLLENSAYVDAESPNKTTPLMMAAMYGSPEAVKLLLDEGADVSLRNMQGLTAIDFAQRAGRADVAEMIAGTARRLAPKGRW